jgi:hypothetical protein
VDEPVTESIENLLEAFRADLQGQLRLTGVVEDVSIRWERPDVVCLGATISVGADRFELVGTGNGVVDAYAGLCRDAPEPVLKAAYRQVLEAGFRFP